MTALTIAAKSTQVTNLDTQSPTLLNAYESRAKLRYFYFDYTANGALAADSIIELVRVPAGKMIPHLSKVYHGALGAGRTMDVGYQEYQPNDGKAAVVAAAIDAFADGIDVSSAGNFDLVDDTDGIVLTGKTSVLAKIIGDTFQDTHNIHGHVVMAVE